MEKDNEQSFCPIAPAAARRCRPRLPGRAAPRASARVPGAPGLAPAAAKGLLGQVFKKSDPNERAATNG
jgi:hypothetical protein